MRRSIAVLLSVLCLYAILMPSSLAEETQVGIVNSSSLNLREKPSTNSEWLGTYTRNAEVEILETLSGWYHVRTADGKTGYMAAEFVLVQTVGTSGGEDTFDVGRVQQVGRPQVQEHADSTLTFSVRYPELDDAQADMALRRWVDNIYATATSYGDTYVDVNVQYNSYWVQGRYIGLIELGELKTPDADGEALGYTLNLDTWEGTLVTHQEIFVQEKIQDVLALVSEALEARGESPVRILTPNALFYSFLTNDGVCVYLPPVGMMHARLIELPYALLIDKGLIALEIDAPGEVPVIPQPVLATEGEGGETGEAGGIVIHPGTPEGGQKLVALTFDDGPGKETPKILEILKQYEAKATFFVVGNRISTYPEILLQTVEEGHEIATHTWSHEKLSELTIREVENEIERSLNAIAAVTDTPVKLLRPPYGSISGDVRNTCRRMELSIILWSLDTEDWRTNNAETTYKEIMDNVQNGSIILCHDLKSSTPDAVALVVPELIAQGYQLVTVSELLSHLDGGAQVGTVYSELDWSKVTEE